MAHLAQLFFIFFSALITVNFSAYADNAPYKPNSNTWVLHSSEQQVLLLGVEHSYDASHPQFADIEKMYQAFKPTLILLEGGNWPTKASQQAAIDCCGEMGFLQYLAQQDGVKVKTWEGSSVDESKFVLEKHSKEKLKLFYVLRQLPQILRDNNEQTTLEEISTLLGSTGMPAMEYQLSGKPTNIDDINNQLALISNKTIAWHDFTSAARFDDIISSPGFEELAAIKDRVNSFRDKSAIEQLNNARQANERVLLIMGKLHFRPIMASL
ncbi:hypothetical protein [Litorilituus sediminis]|uniref:Haem-binding uptake Tiki superfamily ChaN domain-containing protein n=1 Tax=Litorilituus sediminis TaxID=718192 RepID=A0A4P6P4R4_9GAMM|nr:hypothetical protein [Litorilituus sediminis]QBG35938.1 hypothetical protein EMK97_09535 [Litorilituus sediminis]